MDNRKQQAQRLYMEGKTQKEIAAVIGVSERTVYTWVHHYAWDKLRLAACQAPATIADNLCSQIVELQNDIASREPGKRYPTPAEAEVIRKLIVSLERMKKYPSLSQNMQMLETFRNYMRPIDRIFTRKLANYSEKYLNGKSVNGFVPYNMEYGVDPVAPISQFYDEEEGIVNNTANIPCPDINTCLHPGKCTWPHCNRSEDERPSADPAAAYRIPPIHFEQISDGEIPLLPAPPQPFSEGGFLDSRRGAAEGHTDEPNALSAGVDSHEETGSDPAISRSEDPQKMIAPLPEVTTQKPGSAPANCSHILPLTISEVLKLPLQKRPSPFRDGNTLWVTHIDDADNRFDSLSNEWGERKIGDTICLYPDVAAALRRT